MSDMKEKKNINTTLSTVSLIVAAGSLAAAGATYLALTTGAVPSLDGKCYWHFTIGSNAYCVEKAATPAAGTPHGVCDSPPWVVQPKCP